MNNLSYRDVIEVVNRSFSNDSTIIGSPGYANYVNLNQRIRNISWVIKRFLF